MTKSNKSNSTSNKADKRYESTSKGTSVVGKMSSRKLQQLNRKK